MGDSWEDQIDGDAPPRPPPPPPPPRSAGFNLNPNAQTFAFNPNAQTFNFNNGGYNNAPPPPPPPRHIPPPPAPAAVPAPPPPAAPAPPPAPVVEAPKAPMECGEPEEEQAPSEPEPAVEAAVPMDAVQTVDQDASDLTSKVEDMKLRPEIEEPVDVDEGSIMKAYNEIVAEEPRDHLNIVFTGHVDAGKSTLAGQILFITGGVDKRTIEKYEREAKEKNREGWYMAYIMDTNEEERLRGKTVEVGRAYFETDAKRYTILDAPGHKNYVPNMIMGACQADVAILVISARKGEFEAGFERGGQTREHAQLAKTLGVSRLIIVINKLDDPTLCLPGGAWDIKRYDEIVKGLTPFLKSTGYNLKKDVIFLPIAALYGHNIKELVPKELCSWWDGPTLFEVLDATTCTERNPLAPLRMPIVDKWRDMGTIVMGKIESGIMRVGDVVQIMPNKMKVKVEAIFRDEKECNGVRAGENLRLRITGAEDTDISPGFVLCSVKAPIPVVTQFEAQLQILELLEHNPIFTVGYKSVLHLNTVTEECEVTKLIAEIDMKTKEQKKSRFVKSGGVCVCRISLEKSICLDLFADLPALGRFTLRDEGRTIAIGKVVKLPKSH